MNVVKMNFGKHTVKNLLPTMIFYFLKIDVSQFFYSLTKVEKIDLFPFVQSDLYKYGELNIKSLDEVVSMKE